ncbi:AAA family ATPase [Vreelandella neptunia]|uniref:MoxR family ATPase n=1 Tax=Vreelandella neptunia TaxID=115551 RepID=A0ABS9S754_9GAMM|nr:AAA family ATPase [Halomonas neptunia]MCH4811951.1 MoxR family ATPase [Halomonas neptunia]
MTTSTPQPDSHCNANDVFNVQMPWEIPYFSKAEEHVPEIDPHFHFVESATRAILMGFAQNRRVYVYGPHGSGKSSHIEQVAAHLNWPCIRINLDGHITRADLIGRDMVVIRDGKQVTEFVPGMLVWAMQRPIALILDEYDAGRPDVMFVIQRVLETQGKLTLLDQNQVITPHPSFRLFATANTAGQGDASGLYVGTQALNQAQLDRWHVTTELGYMSEEAEMHLLQRKLSELPSEQVQRMVTCAGLLRQAFAQGDVTTLISLRTLISWGENSLLLNDPHEAMRLSFFNRCDEVERSLVSEIYQRCFDVELI